MLLSIYVIVFIYKYSICVVLKILATEMLQQNGRTIFVDELGAILRQISFGLINTSTFSTKCNQKKTRGQN